MANTFAMSTHKLPLPENFSPGNPILASDQRALTGSINHAHAKATCHPVVSQVFGHMQAVVAGATLLELSKWIVPPSTAIHTNYTCEVLAKATAGGGTVRFANGANTLDVAVTATALNYFSGTLAAGAPGANYDQFSMSAQATGGTVTIYGVLIQPIELSSPLATAPTGDFVPFGESASAADYTLSVARGKQIVANVNDILLRDVSHGAWAGLETVNVSGASNKANARKFLGQAAEDGQFRHWFRLAPTMRLASNGTITVALRIDNTGGATNYVVARMESQKKEVWGGEVWGSVIVPKNAGETVYLIQKKVGDSGTITGGDIPGVCVTLDIAPSGDTVAEYFQIGRTTEALEIEAISVWGP